MHQLHVQHTANVHRIIHALRMFANQIVIMTKIVWPTNDVYVERVNQFVTPTLLAELVKYARIDCVKWDAVTI